MRFNINNHVRVRLTEHGREYLRQQTDDLNHFLRHQTRSKVLMPYDAVIEDADGWSRWQLWDLMKRLGPHIQLTGPNLFDMEIEIETENT